MARIVAIISSRADLTAPLLARHKDVITVQRGDRDLGWGVGFYQAGEVLLRRRPADERQSVDLSVATRHVKTDVLLGHIRRPTTGSLRTENTHPFRYRKWLFAHDGELSSFAQCRQSLLNAQPEFLRRNIRGDTDSEVLFYTCLAALHRAGALSESVVPPAAMVDALRAATRSVDTAIANVGGSQDRTDMVLTDGEHVYVVHRSNTMALLESSDPEALRALVSTEMTETEPLERFTAARVCMVVSGLASVPADWQRIEPGSVLTLARTEAPHLSTL